MDRPPYVEGPRTPGGIVRRDFLRKLLSAAVGIPAAGVLLSGCGGGILDGGGDEDGPNPPPAGNLAQGVQGMRDEISGVMQAIQGMQNAGDIDLVAWQDRLNAQLAIVWPLMVAANEQALRDNVSAEMQPVLGELDELEEALGYSGPAPQITPQRLQAAWDRAEALLLPAASANGPYADQSTWVFFLMLFLAFPGMLNEAAFGIALAAAQHDARNNATNIYNALHPTGPIDCTPCLIGVLTSNLLAIVMLLFVAMGSHAAAAPSMLFGRDWLMLTTTMAAIYMLFLRTG